MLETASCSLLLTLEGCCLADLSPQVQDERDDLYQKFTKAINEVQQKTGFKNLLLERKLIGLASLLEKKEVQLNEVLAASNLDPSALTVVTHKLEVRDPSSLSLLCWPISGLARGWRSGSQQPDPFGEQLRHSRHRWRQ